MQNIHIIRLMQNNDDDNDYDCWEFAPFGELEIIPVTYVYLSLWLFWIRLGKE